MSVLSDRPTASRASASLSWLLYPDELPVPPLTHLPDDLVDRGTTLIATPHAHESHREVSYVAHFHEFLYPAGGRRHVGSAASEEIRRGRDTDPLPSGPGAR